VYPVKEKRVGSDKLRESAHHETEEESRRGEEHQSWGCPIGLGIQGLEDPASVRRTDSAEGAGRVWRRKKRLSTADGWRGP
jgi:hypothetical protein